jgi:hypothetical protein
VSRFADRCSKSSATTGKINLLEFIPSIEKSLKETKEAGLCNILLTADGGVTNTNDREADSGKYLNEIVDRKVT